MSRPVSARVYFSAVAVVTALLLGGVMALRPSFAYSMRESLGLAQPVQVQPDSIYAERVAPLFEHHCVGCHGDKRQKAELRLDTFSAAMHGGKHGAVIRAGAAADSELLARILLPRTDAKAMPPQGKDPLSADDATVVKLWIAAGASPIRRAGEIAGVPPPVRQIEIPALDFAAVARERSPFAAQVDALQARYPAAIAYESRSTADLVINASLIGSSFGDADLSALAPLHDRIVRLDVSGTAVTDASAPAIAAMSRLRVLRMMDTEVNADSLAPLRAKGIKVHDGRR